MKYTGPFDLHVLATPPAFVLSQDQTLQFISSNPCIAFATQGYRQLKAQHFGIRTESVGITPIIFKPHRVGVLFLAHPSQAYSSRAAALSLL
jgi:hypothetical protein